MIVGSLLVARAPCTHAILLAVTGCVSALPRPPARAYYIARYLMVTVKIAVKTRYPNVPHPNLQSTADKQDLR